MTDLRDLVTRAVWRVRVLWRRVPPALRSGWITAWITFTGSLLSILTGLFPLLAESISTGDYAEFFDAVSLASAAAVSAAAAFGAGVLNAVWRWLRPIADAYQTPPGE